MKGTFPLGRTERIYGQRLETGIFIEWPFRTGSVWKVLSVDREKDQLEMESFRP